MRLIVPFSKLARLENLSNTRLSIIFLLVPETPPNDIATSAYLLFHMPSGTTVLATEVLTLTTTFIYISEVRTTSYNTLYGNITVVHISTYTHIEVLASRSVHLHLTPTPR
jgi:hypothetical protein